MSPDDKALALAHYSELERQAKEEAEAQQLIDALDALKPERRREVFDAFIRDVFGGRP